MKPHKNVPLKMILKKGKLRGYTFGLTKAEELIINKQKINEVK